MIGNGFTAYFPRTTGHGQVPDALDIKPSWMKVTDRGGSYRADFSVDGPESALWTVLEWMGRKVHVTDPYGMDVWRGKVTEIELRIAGMRVSLSYASMYNRVKVIYQYQAPDGTAKVGETEWGGDTLSQSQHGVRELIHGMSETYEAEAEAKRDRLLGIMKTPLGVPTMQQSGTGATITASGFFNFNEWKYFERKEGRFEHPYSPTVELNVGWSLTGTGFTGVFNKFHDIGARIANLSKGQLIVRSNVNSVHNGAVSEVTKDPSGDAQVIKVSTGIWGDPQDEIYINAPETWDGFRAEEVITTENLISQGATNYWSIEDVHQDVSPQWLDLQGTFGFIPGTVNDEGDRTITVTQGTSVEINNGNYANDDTFGDTETITCLGSIIEQSFTSSFTGEAQMIALTAYKVGTPVDNLRIQLCADNGSGTAAGTVLSTLDVIPGDLPTVPQQIWFTLPTWVDVTSGTKYWVKISRTGSAHHENLFRVGFTADNLLGGETLRLHDGSTYHVSNGLSLSFMVYATEDTREQIEAILSETDQFSGTIFFDFDTTDVRENQYRDGRVRASTLLEELLDKGGPNGRRLIVLDDENGNLFVKEEPESTSAARHPLLWADGRVTQFTGGPLPRGQLVVGEWVALAELPWSFSDVAGELSPLYVGEAELDIQGAGHPVLRPRRESTGDLIESA